MTVHEAGITKLAQGQHGQAHFIVHQYVSMYVYGKDMSFHSLLWRNVMAQYRYHSISLDISLQNSIQINYPSPIEYTIDFSCISVC